MKKSKRILAAILTLVLCVSMSVPAMAASTNYAKAVAKYNSWLSRTQDASTTRYYDIADVDGNGIPELMISESCGYNAVYTYDVKTKKIVCIRKVAMGKACNNQVYYNKKTKCFSIYTANTGGCTRWFYKLNGKKATKIATCEYRNKKCAANGANCQYLVNGKTCKKATYDKKMSQCLSGCRKLGHLEKCQHTCSNHHC